MRDYTSDNPVFHKKISIVEEDDLVSADNDTAAAKQLIENDLVLNDRMEECLGKDPDYGDSQNLIVTFESGDSESADAWTDVEAMQSKEEHRSLFRKLSIMVKNVRYLYKLLGTTDISKIGGGTITGAIQNFNTEIGKKVNFIDITQSEAVTITGKKALDAVEKNAAVPGTLAHELAQVNSNLSHYHIETISGVTDTMGIMLIGVRDGHVPVAATIVSPMLYSASIIFTYNYYAKISQWNDANAMLADSAVTLLVLFINS